ncbi:MAG: hypothetical protein IPL32_08250 [Chloracidobacterium sp.]|nr:hypothetical protein [Chloracidobacterium sp.]
MAGADAVVEFEDQDAVFDDCGWESYGVVEADVVLSYKTQLLKQLSESKKFT